VVEGIAAVLKAKVRGVSRRGAGCPAGSAPITARPPALSNNEAVADNVSSILLTTKPAIGVPACSVSNRMSHGESPNVLPQKCFATIPTSINQVQVTNSSWRKHQIFLENFIKRRVTQACYTNTYFIHFLTSAIEGFDAIASLALFAVNQETARIR
jgi:hypothetical protein